MKHRWKWLLIVCTLGIMGVIFFLSAQPGATSYSLSERVGNTLQGSDVGRGIVPKLFSDAVNANVRKWAHVYIYAALGVSMALTVHTFIREATCKLRHPYFIGIALAILLCFAYAGSDELHQLFVPGRAALIGDVFIDSLGFLPGVFAASGLHGLLSHRK